MRETWSLNSTVVQWGPRRKNAAIVVLFQCFVTKVLAVTKRTVT